MKLDIKHFPHAGMKRIIFKTVDGKFYFGKYDFNESGARRWIVKDKEFTSNMVTKWWYF